MGSGSGDLGFGGLEEYFRDRKSLVEAELEKAVRGYEGEVLEVVNYISRGGKRLRGVLALLVCESLGGRIPDALDAAVAVELVHAASLALDDIVDLDAVRRGSLASWIRHGISKTVLISNMLIPKAQLMIERYGFDALLRVIEAWLQATSGEVMDVFGPPPSIDYEALARMKTGSIFRAAAFLGARAARAGKAYEDLASRFGEDLGLLYQAADDLVDLITGKGLEAHSMRLFARWLGGGNLEEALSSASSRMLSIMSRIDLTVARFPEGSHRELLRAAPRYTVARMLEEAGGAALEKILGPAAARG